VTFSKEIPDFGNYFFAKPIQFDTKVIEKKWKDPVPALLNELADILEQLNSFNATEIEEKFKEFSEQKAINPGQLMQPLRLSVSGQGGGPPIFEMIELIGQKECIERIRWACKNLGLNSPNAI
jgi:glutamyl-tRNA synthetase